VFAEWHIAEDGNRRGADPRPIYVRIKPSLQGIGGSFDSVDSGKQAILAQMDIEFQLRRQAQNERMRVQNEVGIIIVWLQQTIRRFRP
jgi:hypothetical protein